MSGYGSSGGREPMLDMFVFETNQMLEQLEEIGRASCRERV